MSHILNINNVCEQFDYLYGGSAPRRLLGGKLSPATRSPLTEEMQADRNAADN